MRKITTFLFHLGIVFACDAIAIYYSGTAVQFAAAFVNVVAVLTFLAIIVVRRLVWKKAETPDETFTHALTTSLAVVVRIIIAILLIAGIEAAVKWIV